MSASSEILDLGDCACGGMVGELADGRVVCSSCRAPEVISEPPAPLSEAPKTDCSPKAHGLVQSNGKGLPFRHASEVLASVPEKVDWLLRNYIAVSAITLLSGKPKVGKSTFIMEMLAAMATGRPFIGLSTRSTGILILTEERASTLRAKVDRYGLAGGAVHILSLHEATGHTWRSVMEQAVACCEEHELQLIVVDTLDKWARFRGDDEQKSGAVNEAMEPLISAAGAGLAVVVVAHQRKAEGKYGEAVRGSNALTGSVDLIVELERPGHDLGKTTRVVRGSGRFEETPDELFVDLTDDGYVVVGDIHQARHATETAAILAALDDIGIGTVQEIAEQADLKDATVRRRLDEACERGEVAKAGTGKRGDAFRFSLPSIDCTRAVPLGVQSIETPVQAPAPAPVDSLIERLSLELDATELPRPRAAECAYPKRHAGGHVPHPVTGRMVCSQCHPVPAAVAA